MLESFGPVRTCIALGSNLGDRAAHMAAGRDFAFSLHAGNDAPLCSGLYETDPVDCAPDTAPFLNAVLEIESQDDAGDLLRRLRGFEAAAGRAGARGKNSPRPIDLDLLYMQELRNDSPSLQLPHPRMTSRRFVLQPLADIRPHLVLPGQNLTVAALLSLLPAAPAVRLVARTW